MDFLGVDLDFLTIISVVSLLTTVIGLYLLGEKSPQGFLYFSVSLLCQMYIFYKENNKFLVFQMLILIYFNIRNYIKWMKEKGNEYRSDRIGE